MVRTLANSSQRGGFGLSFPRGIGINRRTWQAGQAVGRHLRSYINQRRGMTQNRGGEPRPARIPRTALTQRAEEDGIGGSYSYFNYGKKQTKLPNSVVKELATQFTVRNAATQYSSVVGLQNCFDLSSAFTSADILNLPGIQGISNSRILLKSVHIRSMFTNASNTSCFFDIYDLVLKKDINSASLTGPSTTWQQGIDDEGGSNTSFQIPGCTPFASKSFTEIYKVVKRTKVVLAQGATHVHEVNWAPNVFMDSQIATYGSQWQNCTIFQLIVMHGQVSDAVTGGGGASIGASKLNSVTLKEYRTAALESASTTFSGTNSLPTSFAGGENTISLGSGEVAPQTAA